MANLNTAINHAKYIRSNWIMVAGTFVLSLTAVLAVGSLFRAGGNALADGNYGAGLDGYSNFTDPTAGGYGNAGYGGYTAGPNNPVTTVESGGGYEQGIAAGGSNGGINGTLAGAPSQGALGVGVPGDNTQQTPDNSVPIETPGNNTQQTPDNSVPIETPGNNTQQTPDNTVPSATESPQAPIESSSPSPSPSPSPTQNVTATANATNNVVINQTPQVRTASTVSSNSAPATELPVTGPGNLLPGGFGIAGVIVASSLFAASRRDLKSVPFKLTN